MTPPKMENDDAKTVVISTLELERRSGMCATCSAILALDAAANAFSCSRCAFKESEVLDSGENIMLAPHCYVDLLPHSLPKIEVDELVEEINFKQHLDILPDGKKVMQPRLIAYQAVSEGHMYSYPGISKPLQSSPFSPLVLEIKERVERLIRDQLALGSVLFNSAHLNLYRNGDDHISWHTDEDVALYGDEPIIASVSVGASRCFYLRRMAGVPYEQDWIPDGEQKLKKLWLESSSLLVMRGRTQKHFEHCVVKSDSHCTGSRINVTFRNSINQGH